MPKRNLEKFDVSVIQTMHKYGFILLRISLAVVYLWFGALKVINASPVHDLIVSTYPSFPEPLFITILGVWEIIIGIGLLIKSTLRFTLLLLWLQMGGIFAGFFISPFLYFSHNLFFLTSNGEFVIKNFVLIAASIVIGGNEISVKNKN
ncbi:MAG TPA: hypothetical protein VGT05_02650 [Patescibacteria group bacterium]|nr:hypothetical protein [Patescibacteria group bacterium]